MSTVEERLAYIEGRVQEHSRAMDDFRDVGTRLDQRMDRLEQRMDAGFQAVDRRFERLHDRMSRQFTWLVGIQVTTLVAIVAALLARA